jgi:hypothetical protein
MRKKVLATAALAAALLVLLPGCIINLGVEGSGNRISEERDLEPFSEIYLAGSEEVVVTIGEPQSVTVEADDNLIELVETRVKGDTLLIRTEKNYRSSEGIRVEITVPELDEVGLAGSGDIEISGLAVAGFSVSVTGSGSVAVRGTAEDLDATVTGSGDLRLFELEVQRAEALITGSGDIEVRATESLDASVTGSGDIRYAGEPEQVRKSVTGSGDIEPA